MPYHIVKDGAQYCVEKVDGSKRFGCHETRAHAYRQMAALYAHEPKAAAALPHLIYVTLKDGTVLAFDPTKDPLPPGFRRTTPKAAASFDPALHPREPKGAPASAGGEFTHVPVGTGPTAEWQSPGGFRDTGITWKQPVDAKGLPIPIKVESMEEAIQLVLDGKVIELKDVTSVHTLLDKLAAKALEAKKAGQQAKDFDLCQVQVTGTNLFCGEILRYKNRPQGIARLEMPQLGGKPIPGSEAAKLPRNPWNPAEVDGAKHFMIHLQGLGVATHEEDVPAALLKTSQREMRGNTVASMMNDPTFDPASKANAVWVSSDNYILDGHHRYAAALGRDSADGHLGDNPVHIVRVNLPASAALPLMSVWSRAFGIQQGAGVAKQIEVSGLTNVKK